MIKSSVFVSLALSAFLVLACGASAPDRGVIGHFTAQPEQADESAEFRVRTAAVTNWLGRVRISLTDRPNAMIDDGGEFDLDLPEDVEYHRVTIILEELPTAPGDYGIKRFTYSVRDATNHFNYGWGDESVDGTVTLTAVEGELPGEGPVKARPASVTGSFEVTNSRGGHFSGEFTAPGWQPAEPAPE